MDILFVILALMVLLIVGGYLIERSDYRHRKYEDIVARLDILEREVTEDRTPAYLRMFGWFSRLPLVRRVTTLEDEVVMLKKYLEVDTKTTPEEIKLVKVKKGK